MFPYLLREDVWLELLELRHADELFRVVDGDREHLRRWLPWVDATKTVDDTKSFVRATRTQLAEDNGFQTTIRCDGNLVGMVGHHGIDWSSKATSLGYWIAADAQGRGIITDACRRYVDHAFRVLGLNRVEIRCAVENERSRAVPERLGFEIEGTIRDAEWLYDHHVDHVVYAVLARDWDAAHR